MEKVAIFPGSFDPFTRGHEDIVIRSLQIFDKVVIAIGYNSKKARYFQVDQMIKYIENTFTNYENVEVVTYNELTANLAKTYNARYLVRGLRNTTDFEYENSIAQINKYLNEKLETVFLITSPEFAHISSTIIREVHKYGGDISNFIPFKL
ncbi:MAG: pantetheine-phosphate adenylyltransferase [Cyclobacteriaceae bacterium]